LIQTKALRREDQILLILRPKFSYYVERNIQRIARYTQNEASTICKKRKIHKACEKTIKSLTKSLANTKPSIKHGKRETEQKIQTERLRQNQQRQTQKYQFNQRKRVKQARKTSTKKFQTNLNRSKSQTEIVTATTRSKNK
jgi:hypothetical protein